MQPLPPKREVALALLERTSIFVHLDARRDEVHVPPHLKKNAQLVLQVGLDMAVRIPDLEVGETQLCCTLSFNRSPFYCVIPWTSVFAMVGEDGRGMVWPEDVPPEVAKQAERAAEKTMRTDGKKKDGGEKVRKLPKKQPVAEEVASADVRTRLVALPAGNGAKDEPAERAPAEAKPKRELPPYLRVIK